jgi:hypothetical protein
MTDNKLVQVMSLFRGCSINVFSECGFNSRVIFMEVLKVLIIGSNYVNNRLTRRRSPPLTHSLIDPKLRGTTTSGVPSPHLADL